MIDLAFHGITYLLHGAQWSRTGGNHVPERCQACLWSVRKAAIGDTGARIGATRREPLRAILTGGGLPREGEAGEVFAEAIGVVGAGFLRA
jgi:hypothetical protein